MSDNPITDPLAWRPVKAPSLLDLEILAETVFAGLPEKFRALCEGLVIRVEDFADDDVLDDMEIDDPFGLLGLFQGVGLPFQSDSTPVQMPNMICSIAVLSSTIGPSMTRPSAPSWPMCWCTRSATISDCRTTIWKQSSRPRGDAAYIALSANLPPQVIRAFVAH